MNALDYDGEDRDDFRRIAADWHDGQWSALYAFASSGRVTIGISAELRSARRAIRGEGQGWDYNRLGRMLRALEPLEDMLIAAEEAAEEAAAD